MVLVFFYQVQDWSCQLSLQIIFCWLYFLDPKSGHYPGAINIPFESLFNPDTRTLKTVDELKKGYWVPSSKQFISIHLSTCTIEINIESEWDGCGCSSLAYARVALFRGGGGCTVAQLQT